MLQTIKVVQPIDNFQSLTVILTSDCTKIASILKLLQIVIRNLSNILNLKRIYLFQTEFTIPFPGIFPANKANNLWIFSFEHQMFQQCINKFCQEEK
jgi:hypothetical protein